MAERRMVAKSIIDTDSFLDMPMSSQCLYFHLLLRGDDDGFIANPKAVLRNTGCKDDDMKLLIAKKYVLVFDSGVIVIRHWKIHNYIQKDRYKPSQCAEREQLLIQRGHPYELKENSDNQEKLMDPNCIQNGDVGKVKLGKTKLDQVKLDKINNTNSGCSCSNNNTSLYGSNTVEIYSRDDNNHNNDHSLIDNELAMIIQFYEDNFSTVSSYIAEQIESLKKEYGVEWVLKSMEKAVVSGRDKCNLRYVEGILKSWKNRGVAKPWETQLTPQQRKEAEFVKQQENDSQKRAELAKQKELDQERQREQMEKEAAAGFERQKAELEQLKHEDPERWLRIEINRLQLMLRVTKPAPEVKADYLKRLEELEKQLQDLRQS